MIENEYEHRKAVIEALHETGAFKCTEHTDNVPEAVDMIKRNRYDLVFADILIYEGDIFEVIDQLKNEDCTIPPIVLFTAHEEFDYPARIVNGGYREEIIYILKKPFWTKWDIHLAKILRLMASPPRSSDAKPERTYIMVRAGWQDIQILQADITHVTSEGQGRGGVIFHLFNGDIQRVDTPLHIVANLLNKDFIRVERKAIVNMTQVKKVIYGDGVITLNNNATCPLGDVYRTDFRNEMTLRVIVINK